MALLVPVDFAMLILASVFVYYLRFSSSIAAIRPVQFSLSIGEYLGIILLVVPFWLIIFGFAGLYNVKRQQRFIDEFYKVFLAVSSGITAVIIFIFFRQELFNSRFLVIANWIIAIVLVALGRFIVKRVQIFLYKYGYGVNRVILIGGDSVAEGLKEHFDNDRFAGHKVVHHFTSIEKGDLKKIEKSFKTEAIDAVINCDPAMKSRSVVSLIELAEESRVDYKYVPDFFETKAANVDIAPIAEIPVVTLRRTPLDGWMRIVKRIIDLVLSSAALLVLWPVFALIAIAIRIDSPGPVIYRNRRVGYKENTFDTFKFRSMKIEYCTGEGYGGEKALEVENELIEKKSKRKGPIYKILDDPRRTRVGKFLEKTSLDELPQFINVFLGHMSLVGPRPHQPREVEKYDKHHKRIFEIKPGITGLAQISGRSDLDYEDEFQLDVYYMENWNLGMDLQILVKTPLTLFKKRDYA